MSSKFWDSDSEAVKKDLLKSLIEGLWAITTGLAFYLFGVDDLNLIIVTALATFGLMVLFKACPPVRDASIAVLKRVSGGLFFAGLILYGFCTHVIQDVSLNAYKWALKRHFLTTSDVVKNYLTYEI